MQGGWPRTRYQFGFEYFSFFIELLENDEIAIHNGINQAIHQKIRPQVSYLPLT